MTTKIIYTGDLHCEATHIRSGNVINTDGPVDNRGKGEAFSPTDLVAAALGSCVLSIMGIKAIDQNIDIEGARISVNKVMDNHPRRIVALECVIHMPDKAYTDHEKKLLEKTAHNCPVFRSLHPDIKEDIQFNWA